MGEVAEIEPSPDTSAIDAIVTRPGDWNSIPSYPGRIIWPGTPPDRFVTSRSIKETQRKVQTVMTAAAVVFMIFVLFLPVTSAFFQWIVSSGSVGTFFLIISNVLCAFVVRSAVLGLSVWLTEALLHGGKPKLAKVQSQFILIVGFIVSLMMINGIYVFVNNIQSNQVHWGENGEPLATGSVNRADQIRSIPVDYSGKPIPISFKKWISNIAYALDGKISEEALVHRALEYDLSTISSPQYPGLFGKEIGAARVQIAPYYSGLFGYAKNNLKALKSGADSPEMDHEWEWTVDFGPVGYEQGVNVMVHGKNAPLYEPWNNKAWNSLSDHRKRL